VQGKEREEPLEGGVCTAYMGELGPQRPTKPTEASSEVEVEVDGLAVTVRKNNRELSHKQDNTTN
jgi:hypothetical protein